MQSPWSGSTKIVESLLSHPDIDVNARGTGGYFKERSALVMAIEYSNHDVVRLLLDHPDTEVRIDAQYGDALMTAIHGPRPEALKMLVKHGKVDINKGWQIGSPLYVALASQISSHDRDAPFKMVKAAEIVQTLLSHPHINVNHGKGDLTPLMAAVERQNVEAVWQLVAHPKVDVNACREDGVTPLIYAASSNEEILDILLDHPGILINKRDKTGKSALLLAADKGYVAQVKKMLRNPAKIDVNAQEFEKQKSPLFQAALNGNDEIITELLKHPSISVNDAASTFLLIVKGEEYNLNATSLTAAAHNGHDKSVKALLSHPLVDVNCGWSGVPPLVAAAQEGHVNAAKMLLDHRCTDPSIKRADNVSALYLASKNGHGKVVSLFLKYDKVDVNQPSLSVEEGPLIVASRNMVARWL